MAEHRNGDAFSICLLSISLTWKVSLLQRLTYWNMAPAADFDTFSTIMEFYLQTLPFNSVGLLGYIASGFIAETVHPFDNKTFDLSEETVVADMLRWAASLEKA